MCLVLKFYEVFLSGISIHEVIEKILKMIHVQITLQRHEQKKIYFLDNSTVTETVEIENEYE